MRIVKRTGLLLALGTIVILGSELGERWAVPGVHSVIPSANAIIGRPLTPVSVAGVARRSVRRAVIY